MKPENLIGIIKAAEDCCWMACIVASAMAIVWFGFGGGLW